MAENYPAQTELQLMLKTMSLTTELITSAEFSSMVQND